MKNRNDLVEVLQIGLTRNTGGSELYLIYSFDNLDINMLHYQMVLIGLLYCIYIYRMGKDLRKTIDNKLLF